MVPGFLAHGEMALVRRAMAETMIMAISISNRTLYLTQSVCVFKEDKYERAIDLMKAEQEIHENDEDFEAFMYDLLRQICSWE